MAWLPPPEPPQGVMEETGIKRGYISFRLPLWMLARDGGLEADGLEKEGRS